MKSECLAYSTLRRRKASRNEQGTPGPDRLFDLPFFEEHSMSFPSSLKVLLLLSAALLLQACGGFAQKEAGQTVARLEETLQPVVRDGKYGYINAKGEEVIPPRFDFAGRFFDDELALVRVGDKWGYVNARGEEVIPPRFDEAVYLEDNGLIIVKANDKFGYVNAKGEEVIPLRFDLAGGFAANGLAPVEVNGKYGYIDAQGREVIPPRFDDAESFADNGLAAVRANGKWGYINTQGEEVTPLRFDEARDFANNGLAAVRANGKWGYLNAQGEEVILPRFDDARDFADNGLAPVKANDKWSYIDTQGKEVIRFDSVFLVWIFSANGLAPVVMTNGKWGYINAQGEIVVPPRFDLASGFNDDGLARVRENRETVYIDQHGQVVASSMDLSVCHARALQNAVHAWDLESLTQMFCEMNVARQKYEERKKAEAQQLE
jgi:hypothetical protein